VKRLIGLPVCWALAYFVNAAIAANVEDAEDRVARTPAGIDAEAVALLRGGRSVEARELLAGVGAGLCIRDRDLSLVEGLYAAGAEAVEAVRVAELGGFTVAAAVVVTLPDDPAARAAIAAAHARFVGQDDLGGATVADFGRVGGRYMIIECHAD
jgi:hypothetical protein